VAQPRKVHHATLPSIVGVLPQGDGLGFHDEQPLGRRHQRRDRVLCAPGAGGVGQAAC
jgi:hypothetical protein